MESNRIYSIDEILNLIIDKTGCQPGEVTPRSDLVYDLGCWGDDFHELIADYSSKFNVDMSSYLWYFHTEEEGNNIGSIFFKPPYERVNHIPVTPTLLLESANRGKWLINYPVHCLPKRRVDILINQVLILLLIAFIIYKCSK